MAFDAGMLACTLSELRGAALGARIEKVYQPEKDEIVLQMRCFEGGKRLLINAGSGNPRICFSELQKENPQNPPMFCMLLRKHLSGAKLSNIYMEDFDRIAYLCFDTRDELGFECQKYLIAELMGKYSNLIFTDANKRIISALRTSDFSLDSIRQLIAGGIYTPPSLAGKINPLTVTKEDFFALLDKAPERPLDRLLVSSFMGISPLVAREIVFLATQRTDTAAKDTDREALWSELCRVCEIIKSEDFAPTLIIKDGESVEYSFMPISQYASLEAHSYDGAGELLDVYFAQRDNRQRVSQRASDIQRLLANAESRIKRKLELQREELAESEKGEIFRKYGDLITANIYKLQKNSSICLLEDYEQMDSEGRCPLVQIPLDSKLSPAANAQRYYKKYAKAKNAKTELSKQIEQGGKELVYIYSVLESLRRAESPADLLEIREELSLSGYGKRMGKGSGTKRKPSKPAVMQFTTPDGMRVLCGKNNVQNEYITHKLASKTDYWFHVRQTAGSHVLLVCEGKEPTDLDFTTAAEIAAYYSSAEGNNIAVDYTLAKNIKKPPAAKLGFVIYHTNWTAYVTPDGEKIEKLRDR